jgi:hypothetical protein
MDALSAIEEIVRDLLIFVAVMTALLIARRDRLSVA